MKRKKIERAYYAERNYHLSVERKRYVKAVYYYLKWKYWEWRI